LKRCGKTVPCATLYQMLANEENFDHAFITYSLITLYAISTSMIFFVRQGGGLEKFEKAHRLYTSYTDQMSGVVSKKSLHVF